MLYIWSLTATRAGGQGSDEDSAPPPTTAKADAIISIEIAAPEHFNKRVISLDQPLAVVVTNVSKQPQRIWRDWCSWGYQQLSFELKDASGAGGTWTIRKKDHEFWKNYPDFWTLAPGEPLVITVSPASDQWETIGGPLAELRGKGLTMQAVFTAEPDDQSREHSVWTGRMSSTPRLYQVE